MSPATTPNPPEFPLPLAALLAAPATAGPGGSEEMSASADDEDSRGNTTYTDD